MGAIDRTVQAGPRADEGRYWRALPRVRAVRDALLDGSCDVTGGFGHGLMALGHVN